MSVTSIVKPTCSQCGKVRQESELNGIEIFKPGQARYKSAYCKNLVSCDSKEALSLLDEITENLNAEDP